MSSVLSVKKLTRLHAFVNNDLSATPSIAQKISDLLIDESPTRWTTTNPLTNPVPLPHH
jgi:hypothetical protein